MGTILGKKRKKKPLLDEDGNPTLTAKKKKPVLISEDTGRRVKTRLSAQQTEYMQERFAEKPRWKPQECAELLKVLNTMGPEVTADQAYRWFDNRRNKKPTKVSSAMNDSGATTSHIMKTSRISKDEREMLETAYSQDCAPDMHKARSHRRRDWDLNAPGDKLVRATTGFTTSRDAALPCWPTLTTEEGMTSAC